MGLSGRRVKQRIGKDPRNLSWADDASRFGQAYLEKFGWDASKGLGVSGEGRTSAIKATQKLDMLGIGMRHQSDVEGGIAWRQNRDFEDLLRRLNDGTMTTETTTGTTNSSELLDSFHKARVREPKSEAQEKVNDDDFNHGSDGEEGREDVMVAKEEKKKKKKKKRKAVAAEEEGVEEREGLDDRKERKKKRKKSSSKDDDDDERAPVPSRIESEPQPPRPPSREAPPLEESRSVPMDTTTATMPTAMTAPVPVRAPYVAYTFRSSENQRLIVQHIPSIPPAHYLFHFSPRTHRARIIAAKRMAASNSAALAEILGIPSSSSSSAHPSAVASPLPDPALTLATTTTANTTRTTTSDATATTSDAKDLLQNLTTSSQSVGDYFRAKLNAKAHGERQARPTFASASVSIRGDDDDDDGRAGLGLGFGGGPSRITSPDGLDEEPVRGGIGASTSSMFATMFMPRQPTTDAREENTETAGIETVVSHHHDASDYDDDPEKREEMHAKEERRRKKEERRRKRAEQEAGQVDPADEARAAGSKTKRKHREREPETPDGRLEDSHPSGADGREAIATKKRKKDKKSSKHRGLEE